MKQKITDLTLRLQSFEDKFNLSQTQNKIFANENMKDFIPIPDKSLDLTEKILNM